MMMRRHADSARRPSSLVSEEQALLQKRIREQYEKLFTLKESNGIEIHPVFGTLPIKKDYPDYYAVIKNPVSFNTLKKRVPHYTDPQLFMNDLAQIPWNAKTYNTKGSVIYSYSEVLEKYIKEDILKSLQEFYPKLEYPYLGPLPDEIEANPELLNKIRPIPTGGPHAIKNLVNDKMQQTVIKKDSSVSVSENDDDQENYDEQDENNDADYTDVRQTRNLRLTFQRTTLKANSPISRNSSQSMTPQLRNGHMKKKHVKRGRPPVIDLPYVQRMKNVIKNLRRENDGSRQPLTTLFEKIPDDNNESRYLSIISNPMPLEEIFKKIKTRKYKDFQSFQNDFNLMISNFKLYNRSNPQALSKAAILEKKFANFARYELSKPDTDYMPEGELRYPLDEVEVNGVSFKIGDWGLMNNPNDPTKPTVGQIFKLWKTSDGKKWLNACWYIRPEQTVHRVDRLFYKNEVFKTGQYRDHQVTELVGKGYVVHFTRYQRGDPDININGPLFVCEFRYNENDKGFNKIRTWKACLPEEIRDHEEITIPVNGRKFFKYPSPLKHLLPANASTSDPIPDPTPGVINAPAKVGAVYLRPKVKRDDLGEYSTSDDCPRYIIRPGDPPEEGKIDFENGTLVTSSVTATGLPRSANSGARLAGLKGNKLGQGPGYNGLQGQSFYPENGTGSNNFKSGSPMNMASQSVNSGPNITVHGLKQHQIHKIQQQQQQQQQNKKTEASSYNLTTIVNNLTSKASKANLGQILVDSPSAFVLPISISKNVEVLQRTDHGNQLKLLGKEEFSKRKRKGDILWFKGPSVSIEERVINSANEHFQIPLNSCFGRPETKRTKLSYEEFEEPINSNDSQKPTTIATQQPELNKSSVNDMQSKMIKLPGSFPLSLRPSASFMAFKLGSKEYQ